MIVPFVIKGKVVGEVEVHFQDATHASVYTPYKPIEGSSGSQQAPVTINGIPYTFRSDWTLRDEPGWRQGWGYEGASIYRRDANYGLGEPTDAARRAIFDAALGLVKSLASPDMLRDAQRRALLNRADSLDARADSLRKDADKAEAEAVALREQAAALV